MYAVGKIGSYISQGVYTVSAPFHPFGGAVDIIVVEQPDGSFKSSPWYVRFGKFQGVLKTREKVVSINVNGVDANFNMYLDHKGEAYFLKDADAEDGESESYPSSSADEADGQSNSIRTPRKSKSCNFEVDKLNSADQEDASNGKILARSASQRARVLGLLLGRKSFKKSRCLEGEGDIDMVRLSSLQSAEIAADLLEVKWSTNLSLSKSRIDNVSQSLAHDILDDKVDKDTQVDVEETHMDLSVRDDKQSGDDQSLCDKESGSHNKKMIISSDFCSENQEGFVEEADIHHISCADIVKQVVESSALGESISEEDSAMASEVSKTIDELGRGRAHLDEHELQDCPDSETQYELEEREEKQFDEGHACDKNEDSLSGCRISTESGSERVQSFIYCATSKTSMVGFDGTNEKTQETLYLASGEYDKVHVHVETLHVTTELLPKDPDVEQANNIELEKEPAEVSEYHSDHVNQASFVLERNETDLEKPPQATEFSTQVVSTEPALCSINEVNSQNSCIILNKVREEKDITDDLHRYLEYADGFQEYGDSVLKRVVGKSPSESSEGEQFLFSDLDEFKLRKVHGMDSSSPDSVKKGKHRAFSAEGIKEVNGSTNASDESSSSSSNFFGQYIASNDIENPTEKLIAISNPISIQKSHLAAEKVGRLVESLPIMTSTVKLDAHDPHHPRSHSLDSNTKSLNWTMFKENNSFCMKPDTDREQHLVEEQLHTEDIQISQEQETVLSNPAAGDPAKPGSSGGSWRLWPFFGRSRFRKAMKPALSDTKISDAEFVSKNSNDRAKSVCKPKAKKKIRVLIPTSEQLLSLNLEYGKNVVSFTFSTPMLGKQQVDARIYLWKWNTRIVISDVDGTITKSDVLGQFMPLVGVDWSQTGVTHLFSSIKENGYQLLFLSARAISQAHLTRQFLFNLKQDGKALPDGPVVISPDGLFPSLFREVIRRAPHEFKIACLEDIKACFPSDCNPFYAGFGNRDTDELSYLKVGIPRGKIFIINPKGEVAVNHRVDNKTYSSLHDLVHGIFPLTTSTEQEEFNEWNFWKVTPSNFNV